MSANDTTPSSTPPSGASAPTSPKYATLAKFAENYLGPMEKVSVYKLHSLAREGRLPIYNVADSKGVVVNIAEAQAVLARLSAQGKIRRGYGSFGPDANLKDLSKVALQPGEVDA